MKVLFMTSRDITNPEWAGGDLYHFEVAKRLVRDGDEVTMLCNGYKGCKNQEELQGIKIIRVRRGIFRIFSNFYAYRRYLRGKQDIIVEEAEGPAGPLFSFMYAKEPVVIMWHQLGKTIYFNQFPYPIALGLLVLEKIYITLARKCHIIVPSQARTCEFLKAGFPKDRIIVVPAAFTLEAMPKRSNRSKLSTKYFLILGKIRRYKAYHHAIEALKMLRDRGEKCSLIIAGKKGEGRYYEKVKRLIINYDLQNSVFLRLDISEDEKVKLLSQALALIVTSPIEGFSIVSVEANALGIPVIATDGVPDEVISDRFNGIKYMFGDIPALAEAMSKLLHDEKLRETLAKNARRSSARFSWDKSAKLFREVLKNILNRERTFKQKLR